MHRFGSSIVFVLMNYKVLLTDIIVHSVTEDMRAATRADFCIMCGGSICAANGTSFHFPSEASVNVFDAALGKPVQQSPLDISVANGNIIKASPAWNA